MGEAIIIDAFIVAVIGGLGSLKRGFCGGPDYRGPVAFGTRFFPTFDMFLTFILMAGILLWRPQGLFGGYPNRLMKFKTWQIVSIVLVFILLVGIGFFTGRFTIYLTMRVMILGIFALGYNLLLGRTGLLSFGHGAFYAAGAYGLGFFTLKLSPHPLLGLLVAVLVAVVLAPSSGSFVFVTRRSILPC